MALALSAAALRLLPLGWLHPLHPDELAFFRASERFSRFARGEGVDAVVMMRWLQVPLWIFTFRRANRWMDNLGISAFGRWSALAVALASSWMMIPAIEYRIDAVVCALTLAALLLAMRMRERPAWWMAVVAIVAFAMLGRLDEWRRVNVDPGGIVLLVFGTIGVIRVLLHWRAWREWRFASAVLCVAAIVFVARMNIVGLLLLPFAAMELDRVRRREVVFAMVIVAWCVAVYASVFRGNDRDRAYQDVIMKEAQARTMAEERVWSGAGWAIRRDRAEPYSAAAIVTDSAVIERLGRQPALRRHYVPVWRDLWIPAPNARLTESERSARWTVLRDGIYATYATPALAADPWFERPDAQRTSLRLGIPSIPAELRLSVDGVPLESVASLRRGQHIDAQWSGKGAIGVFIVPLAETDLFQQPPPGATLEASSSR